MKRIILFVIILTALISSGCTVNYKYEFKAVEYPDEAVMNLSSTEILSFIARPTASNSYAECIGLDGTSIVISPYFKASVNGKNIPSYATPVFSAQGGGSGMLHSFTTILVKPSESNLFKASIKLETSFSVKKADVLPSADNVLIEGNTVTAYFSQYGTYTFIFNGRQIYAYTIYIKEAVDEDAEIAAYKEAYGNENVIVYDNGFYNVDRINLNSDSVVYLKSGAFLRAEKTYEIMSTEDEKNAPDRSAFFEITNKNNIIIKGNGIVDFTGHWLHSRQAFFSSGSQNITLQDIIFLNPSWWTVYAYRSDNIKINNISVYGYKINSDAFNICNSKDVTVNGCFARAGDDCFSAKSLGSWDNKTCENVYFENCYAWPGKARAFGITGEIESLIKDITFKNSIVLFRDATWSATRLGSLVVIAETGNGNVENITFENILINSDSMGAINLCVENTSRENFNAIMKLRKKWLTP